MIRAAIFDIDGTLVDSVDLHAQAWHETFTHFGHDVATAAIRRQIGKGGDKLLPTFLSQEEVNEQGKSIEEFRADLFMREYMPRVKPFPKVRDLFEKIKSSGKKVALASSSNKDQLTQLKKIANISDLVDCETSADDADSSKPDPDIFHAAIKCLSPIKPEEMIVIGDTPYDAEGASKANLKTIGVLCGGFEEDLLRKAGCIAIFRDPEQLLDKYENSPLCR